MSLNPGGTPSRRSLLQRTYAVLLALIIVGALIWVLYPLRQAGAFPAPPLPPFTPEPPDLQETLVLGATTFAPQMPGAVRVLVRDPRTGDSVAGAEVTLSLAPVGSTRGDALFTGTTDELGTTNATFAVPALAEGEWTLIVDVEGPIGAQRVIRRVTVQRRVEATLATDRSVYHPGDAVRGWLWALGEVDGRPAAGLPVSWTLFDAHDNPVCSQTNETSRYGTASSACLLAEMVSTGTYRLRAVLDGVTAEREVEVQGPSPHELSVDLVVPDGYLMLDQAVAGTVAVAEPGGGPVAGASVAIAVQRDLGGTAVPCADGETGADGALAFVAGWNAGGAFTVDDAPGEAWIVAQVEDALGRRGQAALRLPVSGQAMRVTAWPESGALKPGIENLVRVRVTAPDGSPVRCDLEATFGEGEATVASQCDEAGLAHLPWTPAGGARAEMALRAIDGQDRETTARFVFPVEETAHPLLIRPDRDVYRPGQEMHVEVLAPATANAVYLDVRANGQPVAAYAAPVTGDSASFDITPPGDQRGTIEFDAYALLQDGTLARDVRQVIRHPEPALDLSVLPDGRVHPAGGTARVRLQVGDARGGDVAGLVSAWATVPRPDGMRLVSPAEGAWRPRAVPAFDLSPQHAAVVSRTRPVPAAVMSARTAYDLAWTARREAHSAAAERAQWGVVGVGALAWLILLPVLWKTRAWRGRAAAGALLIWAFLSAGGILLARAGLAVLGAGAIIALALAWFSAIVAGLVQARLDRDGAGLIVWVLGAGAGALTVGIRAAMNRGGAPAASPTLAAWVALAGMTLAACFLGVVRLVEGRATRAGAVFALVVLVACTWGGGMLADLDPAVPVYESSDLLGPPPVSPTPVPVRAGQAVYVPAEPPPDVAGEPALFRGALVPSNDDVVLWEPELATDGQGRVALEVPLPPMPGGLQVGAIAVAEDGAWGTADLMLAATQPLLTSFSPPAELSAGDRLDLPLWLHNGLSISQTVQVTLTEAPWFRLRTRGSGVQEAALAGGETRALALPIEARAWGEHMLTVTVQSEAWHEVITRTVDVTPDGMWVARAYSWWTADWTSHLFRIPWSALADTDQIAVKLYPGRHAVLAEALDRARLMQGATFDQTAAGVEARTLYARYLQRTGQWVGAERTALEAVLAFDGQRLLSFQAAGGGFSAFGGKSPDLYRSATALRCLGELAALSSVDEQVVENAALWLLGQQAADGTWRLADLPASWSTLSHAELPVTAYVTWALIDAGYGDTQGVAAAAAYLERMMDLAQDPYVLALVTNALVARGEPSDALTAVLVRLSEQARAEDRLAVWRSDVETLGGSVGGDPTADGYKTPSRRVEVTALATHALARAGVYPERVARGLAMLTDSRDAGGTWSAPWATVWALRAYVASLPASEGGAGEIELSSAVEVTVGDAEPESLVLEGDVGAQVAVTDLAKGYNDVQIAVEGDEVAFQIVGSYYTLWSQVPPPLPEEEDLSVEVRYGPTPVEVGDTISVSVDLALNRSGTASLVELELGLPPGLSAISADLDRLVAEGTIAHYERDGQRLLVYLLDLSAQRPARLEYRLRALYPVRVSTGPTYARDMRNPQRPAVRAPAEIEVLGR